MERTTITAGEYRIAARPDVIETFLGSCVGIALYDRNRGIGGLAHIILPEGTPEREKKQPAVYARSCVPRLIAALEEAGARPGELEATVAGGAHILTDPQAHELQIGRRNIVAVIKALEDNSISAPEEDVGGSHGRHMTLFLDGCRVEIRPSRSIEQRQTTRETSRTLVTSEITEAIDSLKPVSDIAFRALELARDPRTSFHQLERLILQDQVLAATILRLINSAYYGLPRRIVTLSRALSLLGISAFRKIVLQAFVHSLFSRKLFAYSMEEGALFHHAVACAQLAEAVTAAGRWTDISEEAYLAALLHDIGKVILERCGGGLFPLVLDRVLFDRIPFHKAEQQILGLDHSSVGAMVASRWALPPAYGEAIRYHHQPAGADRAKKLIAVVHLADTLCNMLGIGMGADTLAGEWDPGVLQELEMNEKTVEELMAAVPGILASHAG